jgi:cyclopropane fatty-acyl-phospholipid synthase-like methyltransferase
MRWPRRRDRSSTLVDDDAQARRHALVGPKSQWQFKRDFQIGFLRSAGLQPDHRVLDLGCGTLRGGIPIIEYLGTGRYTGVDVRSETIDEAYAELALHGLERKAPRLVASASLATSGIESTFDVVWAFSVLIHMTDDALEDCFAFVAVHLAPHGKFFANVNIGANDEDRHWREFPVVWRSLAAYEAMANDHGLQVTDVGSLADVGHRSGRPAADEQRMLRFGR